MQNYRVFIIVAVSIFVGWIIGLACTVNYFSAEAYTCPTCGEHIIKEIYYD